MFFRLLSPTVATLELICTTFEERSIRALEEAVETPPRRLGLGFEVWTSERLCSYLSRTSEIEISSGWLRALLARRRFACGRAKHTLKHLRDPEEVVACEAELEEAQKN